MEEMPESLKWFLHCYVEQITPVSDITFLKWLLSQVPDTEPEIQWAIREAIEEKLMHR